MSTANRNGYFGEYGGCFVPELLIPPLKELERALEEVVPSPEFQRDFIEALNNYVGRPSALTRCANLSEDLGLDLWLKREDLNHTGSHKINNTIGQALLTRHLGKTRLIAETGAGQHGVASATAAAWLGLECIVFMGAEDVERQALNVRRMEMLGAEVVAVESGTRTLKDAVSAALRYWIANQGDAHYCLGSALGAHPFPTLVREFQSIIGREARSQFLQRTGSLPDVVVACVGGGSNAIGMFHAFIPDSPVRLVGVEAAGEGIPGKPHSAAVCKGTPGVLQGCRSLILQNADGQIEPSRSVAPGLDYPGVGPEHADLAARGRAVYDCVQDDEVLEAFDTLSRREGILPALESSHAVAWVLKNASSLRGKKVAVCLSGRGDKDLGIVEKCAMAPELCDSPAANDGGDR